MDYEDKNIKPYQELLDELHANDRDDSTKSVWGYGEDGNGLLSHKAKGKVTLVLSYWRPQADGVYTPIKFDVEPSRTVATVTFTPRDRDGSKTTRIDLTPNLRKGLQNVSCYCICHCLGNPSTVGTVRLYDETSRHPFIHMTYSTTRIVQEWSSFWHIDYEP